MSLTDPWFPEDINEGHAEYMFFFIGGLMFLNLIGFIFVARMYKYTDFKTRNTGTNDDSPEKGEIPIADNPINPYDNRSYDQNHDNQAYEKDGNTHL